MRVGLLHSLIRKEEKLLIEEFQTRGVDLDPGGVAETHLQIQAGWVALLWEGSWNPVTALVIAP